MEHSRMFVITFLRNFPAIEDGLDSGHAPSRASRGWGPPHLRQTRLYIPEGFIWGVYKSMKVKSTLPLR